MRTFDKMQAHAKEHASSEFAPPRAAITEARHRQLSLLHLQSTIGNQAVQRLLRANVADGSTDAPGKADRFARGFNLSPQQPQTSHVTQPARPSRHDLDEHEAEQVAQQVSSENETPAVSATPSANAAGQRKEAASGDGGVAQPVLRDALAAPAHPLDSATRAFMEARFGQDFSSVRVTVNRAADPFIRGLKARALTYGERVLFAASEYAPQTAAGRSLIAHELTHVVQQRASGQSRIALQPAGGKTLTEEADDILIDLGTATSAAQRKPVVTRALALADRAAAALGVATGPKPPANAPSADDAREALLRLGRTLASTGEIAAAQQVAIKSNDNAVMRTVIYNLGAGGSGVAGQQKFLVAVAPLAGEKLAPQAAGETSTQWLDKNTETIGRIFKKLDATGLQGKHDEPLGSELSSDLLEQYFTLSATNVTPEPTGKLAGMTADAQSKQIKADCDVWAAYGARLYRAQGWDTAGYLVIIPRGVNANRDAHAVALAKRPNPSGGLGWEYLGISDWLIRDLNLLSFDQNAVIGLLGFALEIYDPRLTSYTAYYEPAKPGGAYDLRLTDPVKNNLTPYKVV